MQHIFLEKCWTNLKRYPLPMDFSMWIYCLSMFEIGRSGREIRIQTCWYFLKIRPFSFPCNYHVNLVKWSLKKSHFCDCLKQVQSWRHLMLVFSEGLSNRVNLYSIVFIDRRDFNTAFWYLYRFGIILSNFPSFGYFTIIMFIFFFSFFFPFFCGKYFNYENSNSSDDK